MLYCCILLHIAIDMRVVTGFLVSQQICGCELQLFILQLPLIEEHVCRGPGHLTEGDLLD